MVVVVVVVVFDKGEMCTESHAGGKELTEKER